MAASATPSPVSGTTTTLTVLGADDSGEAALTYQWNVTGAYPVSFSANGTNAAKSSTVTFTGAGTYTFECLVTDPGGLTVRSSVVVPVTQVSTALEVTPATATVMTGAIQNFQAVQRDQFNRAMFGGSPTFSVSGGGTIVPLGTTGRFTAGATPGGPFVVTADLPPRSATALVTVAGAGTPSLLGAASATPNPVTGTTTTLAVRATDDLGEANLVYRWTTPLAPAGVTFATNDDNASKSVTATFETAGDYEFLVTVVDGSGNTVTSTVSVTVQATPTTLDVQPRVIDLSTGQKQQFSATVTDQFGDPLVPQPAFTWAISAGGAVDATGEFVAGTTPGGPFTLTATAGTLMATSQITLNATPDTTLPSVSLSQPVTGARLTGTSLVAATATDDVAVTRVEFFVDGTTSLGSVTAQPWEVTLDAATLTDGAHVLTARAADAAGNTTTSAGVTIQVGDGPIDTTAPVVQVLTPAGDALTPLRVPVTVMATDDVAVTQVQLELDGAVVATMTSAPWAQALDVAAGAHTLVALASDAAGNTARSTAVAFTASGDELMNPQPEPEPASTLEPVLGGCGCNAVEGSALQLGLLLIGLAFRARKPAAQGT
jgi:plastocyanin